MISSSYLLSYYLPFLKEDHIEPSDMGALMMKGKLKERIMEILKIHGDLNFLFL